MFSVNLFAEKDQDEVICDSKDKSETLNACTDKEGIVQNKPEINFNEYVVGVTASCDYFGSLFTNEENAPKLFVPIDTHYYGEDDYYYHRHHTYPHIHQPLKSMEPRILMEIKRRIKVSKRLEEKAAKAGVASSVPELLASTSDTRVLIDTTTKISGPVLSLVRESMLCELPTQEHKKKKRKRRRSKKQEPFKPTLCKLSEESSSPLHSANNDECVDNHKDGLLLEDITNAIQSLNDDASLMIFSRKESPTKQLSFLNEIIFEDTSVGFIDISQETMSPFFDNIDSADDVVSNQSFDELTEVIDSSSDMDVDECVHIDDLCMHTCMVNICSPSYQCSWRNDDAMDDGDSAPQIYHHYHRPRNHFHKEHYDKRDLEQRRFSGQDMRSLWLSKEGTGSVEGCESVPGDSMIEDIRNHRCDEIPALSNTRTRNRYFHSGPN